MDMLLRYLPRLTWVTFFVILMCWIKKYGSGFHEINSATKYLSFQLLSYHYLFMGLAWPVVMTEAILSYRAPLIPFKQRSSIKYLHIMLQTLVGLCIVLGLTATTCFKNLSGEKHYFTFHSWVGITAIALYVVQYLAGFYAYIASSWEPSRKAAFYHVHRFLGLLGLISGLYAVTLGLATSQVYDLWFTGFKTFDTDAVYAPTSILQPVMAGIVALQAVFVMLVHVATKQYLPAPQPGKAAMLT